MSTTDTEFAAVATSPRGKGQGINSVPVRFGLIALGLGTVCGIGQALIWHGDSNRPTPLLVVVSIFTLIVLAQAAVTYFAAWKLTQNIKALRDGTEAIAAGDFDAPINVECACEVGVLADSFHKLVSRLNANLRRINMLAHSDALTGLPNRAVMTHMLESLVATGMPGTAIFIDLQGFKKINDAFGYRVGDQLLQDVGRRIAKVGFDREIEQFDWGVSSFGEFERRAPQDITLARFAADQFVALLPGVVDADHCERHAKAVLQALSLLFDVGGAEIRLTAHIGLARVPLDTRDPAEILRFAELAMAAAKQERKPWRFFNAALSDVAVDRSRLESELQQAIERGEVQLHYQPQLDSRSLQIVGFEALARWSHPTRGTISPAVFIPLAEQSGLMPALGAHVLRSAVRQCAQWQRQGRRQRVAINISATQFDDPHFVRDALSVIAECGADPALIEFEITESMAMSDLPESHQNLIFLREAGVQIAIDDFGTGFSNLALLARLPFTTLKIDRSLIEGIGWSPKGEVLVKTIIAMAEGLGHSIVAEGVETPDQRAWLDDKGCHVHQGFLFARPMPAEEIDEWEQRRDLDGMIGHLRSLAAASLSERKPRASLALISSAG
uniref:Diguanylate cyclase/phosphodiesterase n=1 Tax=Rhodopseudomonas palustris (strain BisA53) TaxID=316055 RepID=Q07KB0_RHOP5